MLDKNFEKIERGEYYQDRRGRVSKLRFNHNAKKFKYHSEYGAFTEEGKSKVDFTCDLITHVRVTPADIFDSIWKKEFGEKDDSHTAF